MKINKSNPIMQRMCRPDCICHKSDIILFISTDCFLCDINFHFGDFY